MATLDKILYTARVHTTGGRDGNSRSDDGRLQANLSRLAARAAATNPEQLFAAGYSACFIGALRAVGGMQKIAIPQDVGRGCRSGPGPHHRRLWRCRPPEVTLPGMERAAARRWWTQPTRSALLQRHARQHRCDDHAGVK